MKPRAVRLPARNDRAGCARRTRANGEDARVLAGGQSLMAVLQHASRAAARADRHLAYRRTGLRCASTAKRDISS